MVRVADHNTGASGRGTVFWQFRGIERTKLAKTTPRPHDSLDEARVVLCAHTGPVNTSQIDGVLPL